MRVRIIKSDTCKICQSYLNRLDKASFQYETMDANATEYQAQMDVWKIRDLPVVQLIDDAGNVQYQFSHGTWSPRAINHKISMLKEQK